VGPLRLPLAWLFSQHLPWEWGPCGCPWPGSSFAQDLPCGGSAPAPIRHGKGRDAGDQ